ncbi:MAG: hypothetical protein PHH68_00410 [Candidatus Omnitrophica bacterium]|jgi:hypothetical protein|nr:hypothetical protein [Candidatus Omnitrophota bacterium]MDD5078774.1 hypothetical protein [Candidatus Omnitrophota bacterium]
MNKMNERLKRFRGGHRIASLFLFLFVGMFFIAGLSGCESFSRKFTRHKKEPLKPEEMVLEPQQYNNDQRSKEEIYREYCLYWESWQNEFIDSLTSDTPNRKRQADNLKEAIKNLMAMRDMLDQQRQDLLGAYITKLLDLETAISMDIYNASIPQHRMRAEKLKRDILRIFSYHRIKDYVR